MATPVVVDTSQAVGAFRQLRIAQREALNELAGLTAGTQEYINASNRLSEVTNQINDVNDTLRQVSGAPIENLSNSFGMLSGQVMNLDFDGAAQSLSTFGAGIKNVKISDLTNGLKAFGKGLLDIGKALLSNPIFLLVAAVTAIGAAMFALKDKIKPIGAIFDAIGDAIGFVVQSLKDVSDWFGISAFAAEDAAEKQINAAKKAELAITTRYDNEIKIANAAGKNTFDLEKKKQIAILESAKLQIQAIKDVATANGTYTEDQLKQLEELGKAINDASTELKVLKEKEAADERDRQKKAADEYQKHLDELKAMNFKYAEARADAINKEADAYDAMRKKQKQQLKDANEQGQKDAEEIANKMLADMERDNLAALELNAIKNETDLQAQIAYLEAQKELELSNTELTENEKAVIKEKYRKKEEELERDQKKRTFDETMATAQATNDSLQALSDAFFAIKMANLEKGSAAEMKAAKRQFDINKALAISATVISTIMGVVNALSAQSVIPEPYGTILKVANAVAVGIAGAANVAKISSTKFNPGGGATAVTPTIGSGGNGGSIPAAATQNNQSTLFNESLINNGTNTNGDGKSSIAGANQQPVKVYVTETDISSTQNKVKVIENQAKF